MDVPYRLRPGRPPRPRLKLTKPKVPNVTRPKGPIDAAMRTWAERILDLRHATGFNTTQIARLLHTNRRWLERIEQQTAEGKEYRPDLETIRKIRRVEEQFAVALRLYRANPALYDRLPIPVYRVVKRCQFDPYAARDEWAVIKVGVKRPRKKPLKFPRPERPDDIGEAAIGTVGALGVQNPPLRKKRKGPSFTTEQRREFAFRRWYRKWCACLFRWAASGAFVEIIESRCEREDDPNGGIGFADVEREREWGIVYGVE